jgi:hypothetical protein
MENFVLFSFVFEVDLGVLLCLGDLICGSFSPVRFSSCLILPRISSSFVGWAMVRC